MIRNWLNGVLLGLIVVTIVATSISAGLGCVDFILGASSHTCSHSDGDSSNVPHVHNIDAFPQIVSTSFIALLAFTLFTFSFFARDQRLMARFHATPLERPPRLG